MRKLPTFTLLRSSFRAFARHRSARRVRQVVIGQIAVREDGVDQGQTHRRTVAHRHGHGAIQRNHRRRRDLRESVVQADDLRPVCRGRVDRPRMHCRDRGLGRPAASTTPFPPMPFLP